MATLQDTQEKILSIMIRHKSVVNDVIENGITEYHFDLKYRPLFCGIIDANISGVGLTEQSFQIFIQKNFKNGNYAKWTANKDSQENMAVIGERNQFFKVVNSSDGTTDDIHALVSLLKDEVLKREATEAISRFSDQSKGNFRTAAQNLSERLGNILDEQTSAIDFIRLSDYSEEFMKDLARRKSHPEECLYTGIKEIDATMQVGLRPGTLTLFAADVGGFKCVPGSVKLNLSNGSRISAQSLFDIYEARLSLPNIASLNERTKTLYYQNITAVMSNGIKECFNIETQRGFCVEATANHPFLTDHGYKRLDELKIGDYVAIARMDKFGKNYPDEGLSIATWLGCMIADGGTSQPGYRFTNFDSSIVAAFQEASHDLGGSMSPVITNNEIVEGNYHVKTLRHLGIKYGIDGKKSIYKKLHPSIFSWDKSALVRLLSAMFGCDGSFITSSGNLSKTRYEITYSSSSLDLATDVRDILLKFGIVAKLLTFNVKYKGEYRTTYRVSIRDADSIRIFLDEINFLGDKKSLSDNYRKDIDTIVSNTNVDVLPPSIWAIIDQKFKQYDKTFYGCRRHMKPGSTRGFEGFCGNKGQAISRKLLTKIAEFLDNDDELMLLAKSDIFWDKVVSVDSTGEKETFDISMPVDHNFVANNFITHNTTMMLNIAMNIYKNTNETVLFIPLEMPYDMLVRKIVAREANVPLAVIEKANLLKPEQEKRIEQEIEKFKNEASRFVILDPRERTTVTSIARAIEKRKAICKPRVVVLDYISILSPEPSYAKLQPHEWYGQMCKDLRALGKKHGFAVISAVQLGRDAIKRLRTQKEGQQSVGSEDLRGSHDYSADADNIYAQVRHPTQPSEKLQLFCIKARYGSTTFGKSSVAILDIKPDIGRITSSTDQLWNAASGDSELEAMTKIAVPPPGDDLDIDTPIQPSVSPQISTFNPPSNNDDPKPKKKIPKNDFDDE